MSKQGKRKPASTPIYRASTLPEELVQQLRKEAKVRGKGEAEFTIPKNVIDSLYTLWKEEIVEWGGGLDFEADAFQGDKAVIVPPISTEHILLQSGEESQMNELPAGDYEIFVHTHPPSGAKRLNDFFSPTDIVGVFKLIYMRPEWQRRSAIHAMVIGSLGTLWVMKVPMSAYHTLLKESREQKKKINQLRKEAIPKYGKKTINQFFRKYPKGTFEFMLFLNEKESKMKEEIDRKVCPRGLTPEAYNALLYDSESEDEREKAQKELGRTIPFEKAQSVIQDYHRYFREYLAEYGIECKSYDRDQPVHITTTIVNA